MENELREWNIQSCHCVETGFSDLGCACSAAATKLLVSRITGLFLGNSNYIWYKTESRYLAVNYIVPLPHSASQSVARLLVGNDSGGSQKEHPVEKAGNTQTKVYHCIQFIFDVILMRRSVLVSERNIGKFSI